MHPVNRLSDTSHDAINTATPHHSVDEAKNAGLAKFHVITVQTTYPTL
ncbi:DUF1542 domain-containing protein, partial [Limosilactobacillus reuteri]